MQGLPRPRGRPAGCSALHRGPEAGLGAQPDLDMGSGLGSGGWGPSPHTLGLASHPRVTSAAMLHVQQGSRQPPSLSSIFWGLRRDSDTRPSVLRHSRRPLAD